MGYQIMYFLQLLIFISSFISLILFATSAVSPGSSKINSVPVVDQDTNYYNRLNLAKNLVATKKGKEALIILNPLLTAIKNYEVLLLTAKSYGLLNQPSEALVYYNSALNYA